MVRAVNEGNVHIRVFEVLDGEKAAEAGTDDDNVMATTLGTIGSVSHDNITPALGNDNASPMVVGVSANNTFESGSVWHRGVGKCANYTIWVRYVCEEGACKLCKIPAGIII